MEQKNSKVLPQVLLATIESEVSGEHMCDERGMIYIPYFHRNEAMI